MTAPLGSATDPLNRALVDDWERPGSAQNIAAQTKATGAMRLNNDA